MGWWITLAILVGLAILPLGVSVKYNADGVWLAIVAGPIRIKILPAKKKEKKPKKEKPKKEKKPRKDKKPKKDEPAKAQPKKASKKAKAEPKQVPKDIPLEEKYPDLEKKPGKIPKTPPEPVKEKKEEGGSWTDFLSLIPVVLNFLNDFRRKLRVNRLELKVIMASGDPCDLAINYGKVWAAVGNFMPQLERFLKIQKRNIDIECDFLASETKVIARLDLTITLGRILAAVFKFAFHALVEFLKIMKKRKGGAAK